MNADASRNAVSPSPAGAAARQGGSAKKAPQPASSLVDPKLLLRGLRRQWLLAGLLAVLGGAAVGWAVWNFLPPGKLTATRQIHISATPPSLAFSQREGPAFDVFKATQIATMKSRQILNSALRLPAVAALPVVRKQADALLWLEREMKAGPGPSPEVVNITLQGSEEEIADLSKVVDAVANQYLDHVVDQDGSRLKALQERLKAAATRSEAKLKSLRQSLDRAGGVGGTSEFMVQLKQAQADRESKDAALELARCRAETRALMTQIALMEAGKTTGFPVLEAEIQAAAALDPAVKKAAAAVDELKPMVEAAIATAKKGRNDEKVVKPLLLKLEAAEAQVKELAKKAGESVKGRLQEEKNRSAALGVTKLKERLEYLQSLEKLLAKEQEKFAETAAKMAAGAAKLEDFKPILDEAESALRAIHKRTEALTTELDAGPRVTPFDNREVAVMRPNEQSRKLVFGCLGAVAAAALACLGVGFTEARARRLGPAVEITEQLGLPVVGVLPYCKGGKGQAATVARHLLKEAVDAARTLLLRSQPQGVPSAVLVASAAPGEGKTSLSCHLAASLARAGRKTLLIDADLRKPDVHAVFGQENRGGLCAVLRGEATLADAATETGVPGLRILPAGLADDQALRKLADDGFAALLDEARGEYDFVLIDSSPLLAVSDALMMAHHADGVLFATLEGETRLCRLGAAAERIGKAGGNILGVIVNGARSSEPISYRQYSKYLAPPGKETAR